MCCRCAGRSPCTIHGHKFGRDDGISVLLDPVFAAGMLRDGGGTVGAGEVRAAEKRGRECAVAETHEHRFRERVRGVFVCEGSVESWG